MARLRPNLFKSLVQPSSKRSDSTQVCLSLLHKRTGLWSLLGVDGCDSVLFFFYYHFKHKWIESFFFPFRIDSLGTPLHAASSRFLLHDALSPGRGLMGTRHYQSAASNDDSNEHRLTHTDPETGEARMVSVVDKISTQRKARAVGKIVLPKEAYTLLKRNEAHTVKGNVLVVAQVAGIQAAKATSQLIPLCHPLLLGLVDVRLWLDDEKCSVMCESLVHTNGATGVEMEALTATSVALLTVYDMCKAASKHMSIEGVQLVEKTGGRRGSWTIKDNA